MSGDLLVTLVEGRKPVKMPVSEWVLCQSNTQGFCSHSFGKTNHMSLINFKETKCNLSLGLRENLEYW